MIGHHNAEKQFMENAIKNEGNRFFVVYGRRGNQAGEVVRSLCRNINHLYFYAGNGSEKQQIEFFGKQVGKKYKSETEFENYSQIFREILEKESKSLLIIIDEFQNMVKKDGSFLSDMADFLKQVPEGMKVQVYLTSSSVAWVENSLSDYLGTAGKLLGGTLKVKELQFLELVRLFPKRSMRECIQMYGITGGVPDYLPSWNSNLSLKENICRQILSPRGYLYEEAQRFLSSELRETAVYETILGNIASGKHKLNDLFKATGFSRAKISVYMKNLSAFDVIEKVYSFETGGWENAQKGIYEIQDTFLDFWFTFVYPHQSDLNTLTAEEFYDAYVEPELDQYLNRYFVKVCGEYLELLQQSGELPMDIHKSGRWIGKDGKIDIIIQNEIRENIACICSWSDRMMTYDHLQELEKSMEQARIKAKYRYIFSAGIFDDKLMNLALTDSSLRLIDMNSL